MKRIKQEQHIEIEEKSQQLKFRMQTEIQINKHHALCQASDQLEELDYTKLYFAYSGIRNRRSSRVCYSKCWYAPTYMQRKHGQKYEKVVADSGYESLATTAGSKKMGRPLSLSLTITNLVRSIPLRLRSAEWKTWATTNRMTALSARMADIWTMFQNILLTPKMVQSEKSLFTVVKTARIVLTVLSAARQKRRTEEKRFPSAGNSRKCASSLTGILPPKRENCFGATVPSRWKELSDSSSTTAASNAS